MNPTKKTAETFKIDLEYFCTFCGNSLIMTGMFWMDVEHYTKGNIIVVLGKKILWL